MVRCRIEFDLDCPPDMDWSDDVHLLAGQLADADQLGTPGPAEYLEAFIRVACRQAGIRPVCSSTGYVVPEHI